MNDMIQASGFTFDSRLEEAAKIAVATSLGLQENEIFLIVTNPQREVLEIASALYDTAAAMGARPSLVVQPVKTQTDYAEPAVIAAFDCQPDVFVSLSAEKLGKDREGMHMPYEWNGVNYDHIFHYQLYGARTMRAFWSPGLTKAMFMKTVPIDYGELKARCAVLAKALTGGLYARVTSEKGTDIKVGLGGRVPKSDDGDFSKPGLGGNLPAGEVFVSPSLGESEGVIVFDGSIAAIKGDIVINEPIRCRVEGGFVVDIAGGREATALREAVESGEEAARKLGREDRLPADKVEAYIRNTRSLGELGIGLNPAAEIVGNMLEDEKAFRTCHFAIGSNYDEDAPAPIHLDGLVTKPTIVVVGADGRETVIEREGELVLP
jgi:leucyl aminopeptidase (aminopeptidase T)